MALLESRIYTRLVETFSEERIDFEKVIMYSQVRKKNGIIVKKNTEKRNYFHYHKMFSNILYNQVTLRVIRFDS